LGLSSCFSAKRANVPDCDAPACEFKKVYSFDPYFSPFQKAAIKEALVDWNKATDGRVCLTEGDWKDDSSVRINRAKDQEDLGIFAGDLFWNQHIGLFRHAENDIWIVTEDYGSALLTGIAAHEVGHSIGLSHTVDTRIPSVMHPVVDLFAKTHPHVYPRDYEEHCRKNGCKCAGVAR
jgi:hypothetical protein